MSKAIPDLLALADGLPHSIPKLIVIHVSAGAAKLKPTLEQRDHVQVLRGGIVALNQQLSVTRGRDGKPFATDSVSADTCIATAQEAVRVLAGLSADAMGKFLEATSMAESISAKLTDAQNDVNQYREANKQLMIANGALQSRTSDLQRTVETLQHQLSPTYYAPDAPATPDLLLSLMDSLSAASVAFCERSWSKVTEDRREGTVQALVSAIIPVFNLASVSIDSLHLCKGLMLASLTRELFSGFESDSFDSSGTVLPGCIYDEAVAGAFLPNPGVSGTIVYDPKPLMVRARQLYDETMSQRAEELHVTDIRFGRWRDAVAARLKAVWAGGNEAVWQACFGSDSQFAEVCKQTWALHYLVRAFQRRPIIIRQTTNDAFNPTFCRSFFNEVGQGSVIVASLFPGLVVDQAVVQCGVLAAYKADSLVDLM